MPPTHELVTNWPKLLFLVSGPALAMTLHTQKSQGNGRFYSLNSSNARSLQIKFYILINTWSLGMLQTYLAVQGCPSSFKHDCTSPGISFHGPGSRNSLLQGSDASGPHYRADNLFSSSAGDGGGVLLRTHLKLINSCTHKIGFVVAHQD